MNPPDGALDCQRCPLAYTRERVVWGVGPTPAPVMLLGEAPGHYENASGIPFVGKAGEHLNLILELAGLPRNQVYISNRVKCRPPENRDPLPSERDACYDWLTVELNTAQPEVVVLLGLHAASLAFPGGKMANIHGVFRSMEVGGHNCLVMPTYHPASALRQGEAVTSIIIEDMRKVRDVL